MSESEPLFEVISGEQFRKDSTPRTTREVRTEPRLQMIWFALPTTTGYCTVPDHEEIQKMLKPEAQSYRDQYPVRHVYEMRDGLFVCRDCFLAEADKV